MSLLIINRRSGFILDARHSVEQVPQHVVYALEVCEEHERMSPDPPRFAPASGSLSMYCAPLHRSLSAWLAEGAILSDPLKTNNLQLCVHQLPQHPKRPSLAP